MQNFLTEWKFSWYFRKKGNFGNFFYKRKKFYKKMLVLEIFVKAPIKPWVLLRLLFPPGLRRLSDIVYPGILQFLLGIDLGRDH